MAWSKARRSVTPRLGHTVEIDGVHVFRASSAKVPAVVGAAAGALATTDAVAPAAQQMARQRAERSHVEWSEAERHAGVSLPDRSTLWGAAQSTTTMANWRENGAARQRPFHRVSGRIAAFFGDPRREVDVLSAHVFGYGSETPLPVAHPASAV